MAYVHDPNDITVEMTSDTTPSPNVTSVSSYYAGFPAWRAFDHLAGDHKWLTFSLPTPSAPQWIKFDFGEGNLWTVNKYKMTNQGAEAGVGNLNNPRDWLFQGSNNDADWVTLDSQEDIEWVIDETKEFSFSNSTAYRYYRFYITDYNEYPYRYLAIAELELFRPVLILPTGIPSEEAFGNPTIQPGAVTVLPSGIASAEAFGNPTIQPGAVTVLPLGIASAEAFGNPTIQPGAVAVLPLGIASLEAFGNPTVQYGAQEIKPTGIPSEETFGDPTVQPGPVAVLPLGIASLEAFGKPKVKHAGITKVHSTNLTMMGIG